MEDMSDFTDVFRNTAVLVVGGAGFVGSNLVCHLLACEAREIHVVDNLLSAERENLPDDERVIFTHASITDDDVLASLDDRYDYIFQLATYHGNQSSIHNPIADHENNTLPTLKLLERVKQFERLKKFVYSGAGCCIAEKTFDHAEATSESELISLKNMDSPYAMSKIFGEFYCNYYFKQHQVPTVRARFQNVYGPGEVLGAGQWRGTPATVWRNVTPTFIYKAIKGEALPVENGGIASRDFIYVDDIALGLMACAINGTPGDVYNLASGVENTILEWAQLINNLVGSPTSIAYEPKRDWDRSGKRYGSTEKAMKVLAFEVGTEARTGLQKTIQWTIENLDFIENCMAKHAQQLAKVQEKKEMARI